MAKTFTLSQATVEDIDGMLQVHAKSFVSETIQRIFPHTADGQAWVAANFTRDILREGDVVTTYMIVRDDQTGTIASFTKWVREPGGGAGLRADGKKRNGVSTWQERQNTLGGRLPAGVSEEMMGEFFEPMSRQHEAIIEGRPHYFLEVVATHPEYRKLGLASMMLKWGIEMADKEGLECYLDASPMGKPLYENFGWLSLEEKMDKKSVGRSVPMLRSVKELNGKGLGGKE